jgi:hypothetical protein
LNVSAFGGFCLISALPSDDLFRLGAYIRLPYAGLMKLPVIPPRPQKFARVFRIFLAVWYGVVLTLSTQLASGQTPTQMPSATSSPGESAQTATNASDYGAIFLWLERKEFLPGSSNGLKILNIVAAALIGFAGASAFFAGVRFGFISSESRDQMLRYLKHPPNPRIDRMFFYSFGGIVAAIFQWAQPDVLAPIQAFVLGATWPSVVTRIMSGSTPTIPSAKSIVETAPAQIIKADEKSLEQAIVVVPRKSSELETPTVPQEKKEDENQPGIDE